MTAPTPPSGTGPTSTTVRRSAASLAPNQPRPTAPLSLLDRARLEHLADGDPQLHAWLAAAGVFARGPVRVSPEVAHLLWLHQPPVRGTGMARTQLTSCLHAWWSGRFPDAARATLQDRLFTVRERIRTGPGQALTVAAAHRRLTGDRDDSWTLAGEVLSGRDVPDRQLRQLARQLADDPPVTVAVKVSVWTSPAPSTSLTSTVFPSVELAAHTTVRLDAAGTVTAELPAATATVATRDGWAVPDPDPALLPVAVALHRSGSGPLATFAGAYAAAAALAGLPV